MIDPKLIREDPAKIKEVMTKRNLDPAVIDRLLKVNETRIQLISQIDQIRAKKNKLTRDQVKEGKNLKELLRRLDPDLRAVEEQYRELLYQIPNLPADDVPIGKDDSENKVIKKWGRPKDFKFKPKDHLDLGEALDLIDVKRAAKVAGSRFGYLKNEAVLLELGLVNLGMKTLIKKGFIPVIPPAVNKKEIERGLGYGEHGGWDQMYLFEKDGLNFVSSSEHTIIPQHSGEILEKRELPLRYVGFSTCFRREAGTYGKDTRGIFRVHQFDKVEMNVFTLPEIKISDAECRFLLSIQEELMQLLKIPYRIVQNCTGDLPFPNRRMFDLEAWFPGQKKYRETHSCSNCTDFQTRRLNIKTKTKQGLEFVHALNATVFAIGRTILAILENYQQKNGSVLVPKVLQEYVGQDKIGL
ncbi:serine--tRNA ligase [Patescibacteria group bacterium]